MQLFTLVFPIYSRTGIAFMLYVAGLWVAIVGIALSLFTLGYIHANNLSLSFFIQMASIIESESSTVTYATGVSMWQQDVFMVYLALGLSIVTIGILLLLSGHIIRSRQKELHTMQSHQEEL